MKYFANYYIIIALLFTSCTSNASVKDSVASSNISIERFDSTFYNYLNSNTNEHQVEFKSQYPLLLSAIGSVTINDDDINSNKFFPTLENYYSNDVLLSIYKDALKTFSNVSQYEAELSKADVIIAEKYNGRHLPKLSMHISGFKENTLVLENQISISTDKYLGVDYPVYQQFFEKYQRMQMQPKYIVRDYLKAWIISEIPPLIVPAKTLLQEMIQEGKVLYILSELLPEWEREGLIGYTPQQLQWCVKNESNIWKSIVSKKHLYNNEYFLNQKYIEEAPYTAPISTQSPGRVGAWIGWQIVNSYAKEKGASIDNIMHSDAQKILQESKYLPSL